MRFLAYYDFAICQILLIEAVEFLVWVIQLIEQGLISTSVLFLGHLIPFWVIWFLFFWVIWFLFLGYLIPFFGSFDSFLGHLIPFLLGHLILFWVIWFLFLGHLIPFWVIWFLSRYFFLFYSQNICIYKHIFLEKKFLKILKKFSYCFVFKIF